MFKFRGQRKDNGEWVEGYYVAIWNTQYQHYNHYIYTGYDMGVNDYSDGFVDERFEVNEKTLSVSNGKLDSNDMEIFASYPIDGVMTKGGDVVEFAFIKYDVEYSDDGGYFCAVCHADRHTMTFSEVYSHAFTIIGKQGGEK